MPCDTIPLRQGQTAQDRAKEIRSAQDRLESLISAGTVKPIIGRTGGVAFKNWTAQDRAGVSDVCAYRALTRRGSSALRMAMIRAEAMAGRTPDRQAIAAGLHSHDGGQTWGKE